MRPPVRARDWSRVAPVPGSPGIAMLFSVAALVVAVWQLATLASELSLARQLSSAPACTAERSPECVAASSGIVVDQQVDRRRGSDRYVLIVEGSSGQVRRVVLWSSSAWRAATVGSSVTLFDWRTRPVRVEIDRTSYNTAAAPLEKATDAFTLMAGFLGLSVLALYAALLLWDEDEEIPPRLRPAASRLLRALRLIAWPLAVAGGAVAGAQLLGQRSILGLMTVYAGAALAIAGILWWWRRVVARAGRTSGDDERPV